METARDRMVNTARAEGILFTAEGEPFYAHDRARWEEIKSTPECRHGYPVGGWVAGDGHRARCDGCWQDEQHAKEAARVAKLTPAQVEQEKARARAFNLRQPRDMELELQDFGIYD